jgi:hypothetical protein
MMLKVAAYLDEAHDDPYESIKVLAKANIHYVALRSIKDRNICDIDEIQLAKIRTALQNNNISPILLYSEIGVNAPLHLHVDDMMHRAINIASYYRTEFIHFGIGNLINDGITAVKAWMNKVASACQNANVTPVYEYKNIYERRWLDKLIEVLSEVKTWSLIYDPSYYVSKQTADPFDKYWLRVRDWVDIIDIHDYKTGVGNKPLGFGDCRLSDTLQDIKNNKKQCWILMEPKLGHKHSTATTKSDTFLMAYKRFQEVLA